MLSAPLVGKDKEAGPSTSSPRFRRSSGSLSAADQWGPRPRGSSFRLSRPGAAAELPNGGGGGGVESECLTWRALVLGSFFAVINSSLNMFAAIPIALPPRFFLRTPTPLRHASFLALASPPGSHCCVSVWWSMALSLLAPLDNTAPPPLPPWQVQ